MAAIPLQYEPEIEYPDSDGKPMAETPIHLDAMLHLIQGLQDHFVDEPDVYVAGNMLLYYEEGKRSSVAPDVFVVRGVPKGDRDVYLLWRERKGPCFVLEVTSKTTQAEDQKVKKSRYAQLGVEEYFLFDPRGEYLHPRFQGLRLTGSEYQPLRLDPDGGLTSQTIGVAFRPQGKSLRMTDVKTGRLLLTYTEWKKRAHAAEERAASAEERATAAAERATSAEERAESESTARRVAEERAAQAEERVAEETASRQAAEERAAEAEARLRALAEELERLRRPS